MEIIIFKKSKLILFYINFAFRKLFRYLRVFILQFLSLLYSRINALAAYHPKKQKPDRQSLTNPIEKRRGT
jgi:isoleucyl-tRNA synthetase